jgi:hypothetical protein
MDPLGLYPDDEIIELLEKAGLHNILARQGSEMHSED